jgi:pyrrolidone-carboxylate peptidase
MKLVVAAAILLSNAAQAAPMKVMITSFESYGGRAANGSDLVAKQLAALSKNGEIEFVNCTLPVEFEVAGKKAIECYEAQNPKPDVVVSLGEDPQHSCSITLENEAQNLMIDMFGEAKGKKKFFEKIEAEGPTVEEFSLPVPDMFCSSASEISEKLRPSASLGHFVCNDVAYRMARYLKPKSVPYGFIHVPAPELCKKAPPPAETAAKVRRMVLAGAHSLSVSRPEMAALPVPCENEGVARELAQLAQNASDGCKAFVAAEIIRRQDQDDALTAPQIRPKRNR